MVRLQTDKFQNWLDDKNQHLVLPDFVVSSEFQMCLQGCRHDTFQKFFSSSSIFDYLFTYEQFFKDYHKTGPVASFWFSFIQIINTLLSFIRALKNADWNLHNQSVREMIPWIFAYDRQNYSRYLSLYWSEMQDLPNTHPNVYY